MAYTATPMSIEERIVAARASNKRYRDANRQKVQTALNRWRAANPSVIKAHNAQYYKAHPEVAQKNHLIRRTRKTEAGGYFTLAEWFTLCFACGFRCLCCGEVKTLEADHVIPVSKGGTSWLWNIQPLCRTCNVRKGDKETDYRTTQEHSE